MRKFRQYLDDLPKSALNEAVVSLYNALFEASEGEAGKYFRKTVRSASPDIINELRENTIAVMREECPDEPEENWPQWLWIWFRMDFGLRNNEAVYFAPGLARIVLCSPDSDEKFEYCPRDPLSRNADTLSKLVHYITMAHKDDYTRYLVDKSTGKPATFDELNAKFSDALKRHGEEAMAELEQLDYKPNDYHIVELTDYETAAEFAKYTDPNTWCYFEDEDTFEYYREGGTIRLYLAYKPGFERLEPGDKGYGQSMLGIDIGPNNELIHCNNRYNHEDDPELDNDVNRPGDNRFDAKELSLLLGGPYYKFCPYYTEEERKKLGILTVDDLNEAVERGEDISDIVKYVKTTESGDLIVKHHHWYNILRINGKLLFKDWLDNIVPTDFKGKHCYKISLHDKDTIVDSDINPMLDKWYDGIWVDCDSTSPYKVNDGDLWNMMRHDGSFVLSEWYKALPQQVFKGKDIYVAKFEDDKNRFIDSDGKVLCDDEFDAVRPITFTNRYARVFRDEFWNIFDVDTMKVLFPEWVTGDKEVSRRLWMVRNSNNQFNFFDPEKPTQLLLQRWADNVFQFRNGYIRLGYNVPNDKDNRRVDQVLDPHNKRLLFNFYVDTVHDFADGFGLYKWVNGKRYYMSIGLDGIPNFDHWVTDHSFDQRTGEYWLTKDGKTNLSRADRSLALNRWYDSVYKGAVDGDFVVKVTAGDKQKMNVLRDNKPLLRKWPDNIESDYSPSTNGKLRWYRVWYGDKCSAYDQNCKLLLDDMYDYVKEVYSPGYIIVGKREGNGMKYNICFNGGKPFLDGWYKGDKTSDDNFIEFNCCRAIVCQNGKMNVLTPSGQWLMDTWFDGVREWEDMRLVFFIKNGEKYNVWNYDHIEYDTWFDDFRWHPYSTNYDLIYNSTGTKITVHPEYNGPLGSPMVVKAMYVNGKKVDPTQPTEQPTEPPQNPEQDQAQPS